MQNDATPRSYDPEPTPTPYSARRPLNGSLHHLARHRSSRGTSGLCVGGSLPQHASLGAGLLSVHREQLLPTLAAYPDPGSAKRMHICVGAMMRKACTARIIFCKGFYRSPEEKDLSKSRLLTAWAPVSVHHIAVTMWFSCSVRSDR